MKINFFGIIIFATLIFQILFTQTALSVNQECFCPSSSCTPPPIRSDQSCEWQENMPTGQTKCNDPNANPCKCQPPWGFYCEGKGNAINVYWNKLQDRNLAQSPREYLLKVSWGASNYKEFTVDSATYTIGGGSGSMINFTLKDMSGFTFDAAATYKIKVGVTKADTGQSCSGSLLQFSEEIQCTGTPSATTTISLCSQGHLKDPTKFLPDQEHPCRQSCGADAICDGKYSGDGAASTGYLICNDKCQPEAYSGALSVGSVCWGSHDFRCGAGRVCSYVKNYVSGNSGPYTQIAKCVGNCEQFNGKCGECIRKWTSGDDYDSSITKTCGYCKSTGKCVLGTKYGPDTSSGMVSECLSPNWIWTTSNCPSGSTGTTAPPGSTIPPTTAPSGSTTTVSGQCGNPCTVCILEKRTDILPFYQSRGWDTSCNNRDAIIDNWCIISPVDCPNAKRDLCGNVCGSTSTTAPPSTTTTSTTTTSTATTSTTTTLPPVTQFTLSCDKESMKVDEVTKCSVKDCISGLWVVVNKEKTPLDPLTLEPIKDIPPTKIEIKPTKTDGLIKAYAICFEPVGMKQIKQEKLIAVTGGSTTSSSTSTTTTQPSSNELVCHFDNSFTCSGGETTDQEILIDNFADGEKWQESMMTGSTINGEYQGQIVSTVDPYMFMPTSFDESLNHISMKYKGYPKGPSAIKIYYTDNDDTTNNDCDEFDEKCSQSFPITVTSDYQLLSLDMTDAEWIDNDGLINQLKIDFESATDAGTIFLDLIRASSAGFAPGKSDAGAVIKTGNTLTYPTTGNINPDKGTIDFWVKPLWNGNDGITHYLFDTGATTDSNRLSIYKDSANKLIFSILDPSGNGNSIATDISSWKADELHDIRVTWKVNEMQLYVDNNLIGTDSSLNVPTSLGNNMFIGSSMNKVDQANAVIDELVIGSSVTPPATTTTSTSTTIGSTTTLKQEFDMDEIACNENTCSLSIIKNTMNTDVVVYINLVQEPEGTIYYKGSVNIDKGTTGSEIVPLNNVRSCSGQTLTAIATAYRIDNLSNRIDRLKEEVFEC